MNHAAAGSTQAPQPASADPCAGMPLEAIAWEYWIDGLHRATRQEDYAREHDGTPLFRASVVESREAALRAALEQARAVANEQGRNACELLHEFRSAKADAQAQRERAEKAEARQITEDDLIRAFPGMVLMPAETVVELKAERDALQARLDAAQRQEPLAWFDNAEVDAAKAFNWAPLGRWKKPVFEAPPKCVTLAECDAMVSEAGAAMRERCAALCEQQGEGMMAQDIRALGGK